jgi:hypothetical protein
MIFCSHRELRWACAEPEDCPGFLQIAPETADEEIWVAECDRCSLTIGIPPRQRRSWFQDQGLVQ